MRDHVLFFINGQRHQVHSNDALRSLSDYLRRHQRLTGTKIVCEEGDCGSCSVLMARLSAKEQPSYKSIDSCIAFLFQLDGCHLVTVEGLGRPNALNPVQQAMVDCHGSQCGFCTPGFVVAMSGVLEAQLAGESGHCEPDWRTELSGNLCRCTGYAPILSACEAVEQANYRSVDQQYPSQGLWEQYVSHDDEELALTAQADDGLKRVYSPTTLRRALELRTEFPQSRLIAGGTDMGVLINKRGVSPDVMIDLGRVKELQQIKITNDVLAFGSGVTWTDMLPSLESKLSRFAEIVSIFGSPQVRNMGTIGGNIANASPIADSLPLLHVLECELVLSSLRGARTVNINQFYTGYKQLAMESDELISEVRIPLPNQDEKIELVKVSRRRDMDISTFTAAIRIHVDQTSKLIDRASIAFGAVGPTVMRLKTVEEFLVGKPMTIDNMQTAGELAASQITPISDVRGSSDYRLQLARNVFLKFYFQATNV